MNHAVRTAASLVAMGLSLAGTLAPRSAGAQTVATTTDVLTLRDGTVLRGQITELRPGRAVTVVLLSGETRTVAWETLAAPPATVTTAIAVAAPRSEQDEYLMPGPGRVPVDIAAVGGPVVLGVQTSGGSSFASGRIGGRAFFASGASETHSLLCEAPCRLYVRPGYLPLWTGGRANHAAITEVHVPANGLQLDAHASSHAAWWGGIFTATLGGTVLLTGALLFSMPPDDNAPAPCFAEDQCRGIAIGLMAGGALATMAGIWWTAANGGGVTTRRAPKWTAGLTPTQGGAVAGATVRF